MFIVYFLYRPGLVMFKHDVKLKTVEFENVALSGRRFGIGSNQTVTQSQIFLNFIFFTWLSPKRLSVSLVSTENR